LVEKTTLIIGTLLDDDATLTLADLCRSFGMDTEELVAMVHEGLLEPRGEEPSTWTFPAPSVRRLRTALWLQHELDVNLPGTALALDLMEEVRRLRARLRVLEHQERGHP
jgi:chaperone modulatory protein CbpM